MVKAFTVKKNSGIPTHKVLALEIEEDDREEETMQLRKLGSMKRQFDDLMERYTNGLEER